MRTVPRPSSNSLTYTVECKNWNGACSRKEAPSTEKTNRIDGLVS